MLLKLADIKRVTWSRIANFSSPSVHSYIKRLNGFFLLYVYRTCIELLWASQESHTQAVVEMFVQACLACLVIYLFFQDQTTVCIIRCYSWRLPGMRGGILAKSSVEKSSPAHIRAWGKARWAFGCCGNKLTSSNRNQEMLSAAFYPLAEWSNTMECLFFVTRYII